MFKRKRQEGLFRTTLRAGFLNLVIGALALILDTILNIPPLPISKSVAFISFLILIIVYAALLIWSAFLLTSAKKKNKLATTGIYALIRHPMYAGIIILVNPALAILLRSWSLLEACLIFYFIWRHFVKKEEKQLIKDFGEEYKEYSKKVSCLFPTAH